MAGSRTRIIASVQQTTSFRRSFMRALRDARLRWQMTLRDPRFARGRTDTTTYRFGGSIFFPALPPTHNNCFSSLFSRRADPSLCVPVVYARLTFQIPWNHRSPFAVPLASGSHKNCHRNRMPDAPTQGCRLDSRNGPPRTLYEHPSFRIGLILCAR